MSLAVLLNLFALLAVHESALAPLNPASAVRGYVRGVDSAGIDPAAVAASDSFSLQYRHRIVRGETGIGRLGGFLTIPLWRLVVVGGYEWFRIPKAHFERGTIGIAGEISKRLMVGLTFHGLSSEHQELRGMVWSFGLFSELTSWLSLSAGIDGFNRPHLLNADIRPDYVFGASVRPIVGEPWLSLGAEVRIGAGAQRDYNVQLNRAVIDVSPLEGVHLVSAYSQVVDNLPAGSRLDLAPSHQVWFGLSLALGAIEASASALGFTEQLDEGDPFADTQLALSLRYEPGESLIDPGGRVVEVPLVDELRAQAGVIATGSPITPYPFWLDRLASDPTVGTVLIPIGALDVGLATIDELRASILRLRRAGKKTIATISTADDKSYMVAAACDLIRMDPTAVLNIDGFAVALRYYAEGLRKIGVRFDAVTVGQHKTGPDPLTETRARPEELATQQRILEQAYESLMTALTRDRDLTREAAEGIVAEGMLTATAAVRAGLVDELTTSPDPTKLPNLQPRGEQLDFALDELAEPSRRWGQVPVITVIPVVGTIVTRASDNPLPGPSAEAPVIIQALEEAAGDGDVAAVVLRVESPGGDVLASDIIWRAVRRLADIKPVVVSMGDVAASGGYWIATPAHAIYARENTVTGSIGIFSVKADLSGLFELIGLNTDIVKKGEHADWDKWSHPLRDPDRERLRHTMDSYYETFIQKVAVGRYLPLEKVRELAEGRVYTGAEARREGLVDCIGGLADAVREARRLAELSPGDDVIIQLPEHQRTVLRIFKNLTGALDSTSPVNAIWEDLQRRVRLWDGRVLALLPTHYEVLP